MSASRPVQPQVRRNVAAAPSGAPQATAQPAPAPQGAVTQVFDFSKPRGEDPIRLHLADIPVMRSPVNVDVFAPTLLSRFLDLFGPRR
jgi:hypothetical protein